MRVLIFAHLLCAKNGNFRADLFSRTLKVEKFRADLFLRTSKTSFFVNFLISAFSILLAISAVIYSLHQPGKPKVREKVDAIVTLT